MTYIIRFKYYFNKTARIEWILNLLGDKNDQ